MNAAETVIDARRPSARYWRDLWAYRELLRILAWRDLAVRYRQAAFGLLWAVGRPLLTALVFTVVFGVIAGLPSGGPPYALVVLSGLLVWQLFAGGVQDAAQSLVSNAALVTKVYFPRMLAPAAAVVVALVDAASSLILLLVLATAYGWWPQPACLLLLLPALTLASILTLGAGLWLAALNVRYRDVRLVLPFALQIGLYLSPVAFTSAVVPERLQWLLLLNPLGGAIDLTRAAVLGLPAPSPLGLVLSTVWALAVFVSGALYFRATERSFADTI